jgi:AraC family transcriptional regulator of adaptative response/methylated-DNA-[protein]-cysteine methyltransferase
VQAEGCRLAGAGASRESAVWLDAHEEEKPTLARLARVAGLSPWHLQRSFTRLYGVSPRDYAAARRVGRLKAALRAGSSSTDAVYEAGYGSPSRVYARPTERWA